MKIYTWEFERDGQVYNVLADSLREARYIAMEMGSSFVDDYKVDKDGTIIIHPSIDRYHYASSVQGATERLCRFLETEPSVRSANGQFIIEPDPMQWY